eukprot:m.153578 g.153578  ORF g.153578 m.153578 type:complete len:389 (+) comp30839_c0_seq10:157-1323(+)
MRTWMQMATPSSRRLRIVSRQLSMMNADPELLCPDPELLCTNVGTIGLHVVLNRPSKLNALSMTIIDLLQATFDRVVPHGSVEVIVMEGAGDKAFCAGGDVARVRQAGLVGESLPRDFFEREYQLVHVIGTQKKATQVSLWNGITMGGGVGLSVHGSYRVCTSNTVFAKPECAIGFFPDVGGSHFLSRLPSGMGMFIGLTGARLNARDLMYAEIATHYVSVGDLAALRTTLLTSTAATVLQAIESFSCEVERVVKPSNLEIHQSKIARCFGTPTSVTSIFEALVCEPDTKWATPILQTLCKQSPTSLKATFQLIQMAKHLDLGDCLKLEFDLCQNIVGDISSDFYEGVRAVLVDKDRSPVWPKGRTLEDVADTDVDRLFSPIKARLLL